MLGRLPGGDVSLIPRITQVRAPAWEDTASAQDYHQITIWLAGGWSSISERVIMPIADITFHDGWW